jgi:glutathione S-transferase
MTSITLFAHPDSGHSYKVKLALEVAAVAHHYQVIDIGLPHAERPEPFRSLSPYGEVPLLLMGGQAYAQSNAILCWVAEHTRRFGGESDQRMARCREWLFWEANRLGLSLPHLRFARSFDPASYPDGAVTWLKTRFDKDIARLELAFTDGRKFILDDQPSVADFSLCGYLFWADQAQLQVPPQVTAWLERIRQLPGWAAPHVLLAPT